MLILSITGDPLSVIAVDADSDVNAPVDGVVAPIAVELMPAENVPVVPDTAPVEATLEGVIAPSVNVMAGVVVAVATVPDTPLAVTTETVVTVPPPAIVLQPKPVPVVHVNAEVAALHEGTAKPLGVVVVSAPRTVFAVCVASCALVA